MNLKERQTVNALLRNAATAGREGFRDCATHTIPVGDLCEEVFGTRRGQTNLRRALRALLTKPVEWEYLTERSKRTIGATTWLSGYDINDGILRYSYSPQLVNLILHPQRWANLNYSIQLSMTRAHAQSLYEQCARYRRLQRTSTWSLDTLRGLLGVESQKSYREFKSLNRSVIKPAVAEINEKTEILVEPHFEKDKGVVERVWFSVLPNANYTGPEMTDVLGEAPAADLDALEGRSDTYEQLLVLGLNNRRALSVIHDYEEGYVQEILTVVCERLRQGAIHNVPGYLIKALENDYRQKVASNEVKKKQAALALDVDENGRNLDDERRQAQKELDEFETRMLPKWRAERWLSEVDDEERRIAWARFVEETSSGDNFSAGLVLNKPDSDFTQGIWRQFIREEYLDATDEEVRQLCAEAVGFDIKTHRSMVSGKA